MARGVYRIDSSAPDGLQVFQLHPGAWHFAAGHIAKLELLGQDSPYVRTSNGQFSISVSDLQLRLPVHEVPGAPGTPVERDEPVAGGPAESPPRCRLRRATLVADHPPPNACLGRRVRRRGNRRRASLPERPGRPAAPAAARQGVRDDLPARGARPLPVPRAQRQAQPSCGRAAARSSSSLAARRTGACACGSRAPPGHYLIRADAVDRLHHHQRRTRRARSSGSESA